MNALVLDTNILFSTLIGGRKVKETFIKARTQYTYYTPATAIEEFESLLPKASKHTKISEDTLRKIYASFIKPAILAVEEDTIPLETREKAKKLVTGVDPSDWPFVALSMYLDVPLWTGDKELIKLAVRTGFRDFIAVDTRAVEMMLEGRGWREIEEYLRKMYG